MKEEVRVLIKYRLERSHEALEEARMLLEQQKADYADLVRFDIEEVRDWYGETEGFLSAIEKIIKEEITPA